MENNGDLQYVDGSHGGMEDQIIANRSRTIDLAISTNIAARAGNY
ncbi:MAG: hypothetical protein U0X92_12520 [Anaerolineales bacterium]